MRRDTVTPPWTMGRHASNEGTASDAMNGVPSVALVKNHAMRQPVWRAHRGTRPQVLTTTTLASFELGLTSGALVRSPTASL